MASAAVVAIDSGLILRPTIFGLMPTMSASSAARARIFGPPPPIMIGIGECGLGTASTSATR